MKNYPRVTIEQWRVFQAIIDKAEKGRFHTIRKNHVKDGKPRINQGNFPIRTGWHYFRIQRYQNERKHAGQHSS